MFYLPVILRALLLVNTALLVGYLSTTADMIRDPPEDDLGWVVLYNGRGQFGWLCRIATLVRLR